MVLTGDVTQIDLPKTAESGLEKCAAILGGIEGIGIMRLNNRDVVRNKLVKDMVKAFEKAENERGRNNAPAASFRGSRKNR